MVLKKRIVLEEQRRAEKFTRGRLRIRGQITNDNANFVEQLQKEKTSVSDVVRGETKDEADLSKPSINDAQMVVVVLRTLGQILNLGFIELLLALVFLHLSQDGIFLEGL